MGRPGLDHAASAQSTADLIAERGLVAIERDELVGEVPAHVVVEPALGSIPAALPPRLGEERRRLAGLRVALGVQPIEQCLEHRILQGRRHA